MSGARTTTASPTRIPGFLDHVVEQEGRGRPRVPAARRQHAAVRRATTACAPATTSTSSSPASSPRSTGSRWTRRSSHCTRGFGIWDWASNDDGPSQTWSWPAPATCPRSRRSPPSTFSASTCPSSSPLRQRRRPDAPPAGRRAPARAGRRRVRRAVHHDKPVIFAFHGYPWLIHRLTYRRSNHQQHPRARLQGRGHDDDAVRHGRAQRPRPVPPGHRRDRPRARPRRERRGRLRQQMATAASPAAPTRARHGEDRPDDRGWTWPHA